MDEALRVREFWFGKSLTGTLTGPPRLLAKELQWRCSLWFESNPQLQQPRDEEIRSQFETFVERAARGEFVSWADSPRRRLSLVILLDQFSRQIWRGTAKAFAHDGEALALVLSGMQSAADGALNIVERLFFYMPLQHAESTEVQDESVSAYKRLLAETPVELRPPFQEALSSAQTHRNIIGQFRRFPHRNAVLGRQNTPEEAAYLKKNPYTFGQ